MRKSIGFLAELLGQGLAAMATLGLMSVFALRAGTIGAGGPPITLLELFVGAAICLLTGLGGYGLGEFGRRLQRLTWSGLRASDPRRPILLLFLSRLMGSQDRLCADTLEEAITDVVSVLGPTITIGGRDDYQPAGGATRVGFDARQDQDLTRLAEGCRLTILVLDGDFKIATMAPELSRVRRIVPSERLILLLPPTSNMDIAPVWKALQGANAEDIPSYRGDEVALAIDRHGSYFVSRGEPVPSCSAPLSNIEGSYSQPLWEAIFHLRAALGISCATCGGEFDRVCQGCGECYCRQHIVELPPSIIHLYMTNEPEEIVKLYKYYCQHCLNAGYGTIKPGHLILYAVLLSSVGWLVIEQDATFHGSPVGVDRWSFWIGWLCFVGSIAVAIASIWVAARRRHARLVRWPKAGTL